MDHSARRAAAAAYKERKPQAGVFAVRCAVTGEVWVGRTADLASQENSFAFQMRHGPREPSLRAAWAERGAGSLSFEALERAPEDLSPLGRADFLKEALERWRAELGARSF